MPPLAAALAAAVGQQASGIPAAVRAASCQVGATPAAVVGAVIDISAFILRRAPAANAGGRRAVAHARRRQRRFVVAEERFHNKERCRCCRIRMESPHQCVLCCCEVRGAPPRCQPRGRRARERVAKGKTTQTGRQPNTQRPHRSFPHAHHKRTAIYHVDLRNCERPLECQAVQCSKHHR